MTPTSLPTVISVTNPRVVEARKLAQRKHREEQGRFLVEGLQVLHMALDAGAQPVEVFYCESLFTGEEAPRLIARLRATEADMVAVSPAVLARLSEREQPQGIVVAFALFEAQLADLRLNGAGLLLVLDRIQDPGNLGTLIRTADAVGAAGVILIEPCVDPFDPKVARSTMGSLFHVPLVRTADVTGLARWLRACDIRLIGADVHRGVLWGEGVWSRRVALAMGNEARGLSDDLRAEIEAWVRLPMVGKAESLNVAVAGGVLMYLWARAGAGLRSKP